MSTDFITAVGTHKTNKIIWIREGSPIEKAIVQITANFKSILFDYCKLTIWTWPDIMPTLAATVLKNEQISKSNFMIDGYTANKGNLSEQKDFKIKNFCTV